MNLGKNCIETESLDILAEKRKFLDARERDEDNDGGNR